MLFRNNVLYLFLVSGASISSQWEEQDYPNRQQNRTRSRAGLTKATLSLLCSLDLAACFILWSVSIVPCIILLLHLCGLEM